MTDAPRRSIPLYSLYGEDSAVETREFVHIEDLATRSSLYDWEIKPHAHGALFQVLVVTAGAVGVSVDGAARQVAGPAVITVPPGIVHGFQMTPATTGAVISVAADVLTTRPDMADAGVLFDVLAHPEILDFSTAPEPFAAIRAIMEGLDAEVRWPQTGRAMMLDALLRGLIVLLRRRMAVPSERDAGRSHRRRVFTRFRDLVDRHYKDRWRIGAYAAAVGVSESKLNRVCDHFAGKSAFEVVQDRLLLEARRHLIYTAAPVAEITYDLGFNDPAYFCRYFKARTGTSPRAFRRDHGGP